MTQTIPPFGSVEHFVERFRDHTDRLGNLYTFAFKHVEAVVADPIASDHARMRYVRNVVAAVAQVLAGPVDQAADANAEAQDLVHMGYAAGGTVCGAGGRVSLVWREVTCRECSGETASHCDRLGCVYPAESRTCMRCGVVKQGEGDRADEASPSVHYAFLAGDTPCGILDAAAAGHETAKDFDLVTCPACAEANPYASAE